MGAQIKRLNMPELTLVAIPQVQWIVTLIAIDVLLGIIAALVKKDFRLGKVANFMLKPVLGYVFGFAILVSVAQVFPFLAMFTQVAYFLIVLALLGSILNNLSRFGISLPGYLKK